MSNSKKGGNDERYEKMSPQELVFQIFTNRMKRALHQVARYTYGGITLWSIPIPSTATKTTKQKFANNLKKKSRRKNEYISTNTTLSV